MTQAEFQCLACKGLEHKLWLLNCPDVYRSFPGEYDYVECAHCGTVQLLPIPEDTSAFYKDYPMHRPPGILWRIGRLVLPRLTFRKFQGKGEGKLLDYGCGDGSFLAGVSEDVRARIGFEPNPEYAKRLSVALGVPVYSDRNSLIESHKEGVDYLTMHMVVEHLQNLDEAFSTARVLLSAEGVFYFVIPNVKSWESRLFGRLWHGLDAPRHVVFPSNKGIEILAARHKMKCVAKKYLPFPNTIAGSLAAIGSGRYNQARFLLMLPIAIILSLLLPTGTVAYTLKRLS